MVGARLPGGNLGCEGYWGGVGQDREQGIGAGEGKEVMGNIRTLQRAYRGEYVLIPNS